MSDWVGWVFTSVLLGALLFVAYVRRGPRELPPSPTPTLEVTLTFNGLIWNADAKWASLRDRDVATMALVELAQKISKQGKP